MEPDSVASLRKAVASAPNGLPSLARALEAASAAGAPAAQVESLVTSVDWALGHLHSLLGIMLAGVPLDELPESTLIRDLPQLDRAKIEKMIVIPLTTAATFSTVAIDAFPMRRSNRCVEIVRTCSPPT